MGRIPLFRSHPRPVQVAILLVGPIGLGAICGIVLGSSEVGYLVLSVIGIGGGFFAGAEHLGARDGALRGLWGGTLFGASILVAHELEGSEAKADLPDPAILLVAVTVVFGTLLGAWGGSVRAKREAKAASAA